MAKTEMTQISMKDELYKVLALPCHSRQEGNIDALFCHDVFQSYFMRGAHSQLMPETKPYLNNDGSEENALWNIHFFYYP